MSFGYDESHWYGKSGWPRLRGQIVSLAIEVSEELFAGLCDPDLNPAPIAARFVDRLTEAIGDRVDRLIRAQFDGEGGDICPSSMWAFALPLLADREALCDAIASEAPILRGSNNRGVSPESALGQIIRSFLEGARREQSPATEHRQKTWEMVDRVSLDVARLNLGTALEDRSSDEHLMAVQRALREKYPTNKNVNVSLGTLRGYFDEFCSETEERNHTELMALKDETGVWPAVDPCLDQLKVSERDLWEALAVKTGYFDDIGPTTMKDFLGRTGLSRRGFEARWVAAAQAVLDCYENSLSFQLQRWQ